MILRFRQLWLPALRLAFVGLLFAVLVRIVDLGDALGVLADVEPPLALAALALFGVGQVLSCLRWRLALSQLVPSPPAIGTLLRLYLIGMFVNLGIPTMTGGDIVRAELVRRLIGAGGGAYASIFVDRLIGVVAVVIVAAGAVLLAGGLIDAETRRLVAAAAFALSVALALLLFGLHRYGGASRLASLNAFLDALRLLARRPGILALSLAIAISVQVVGVVVPIVLLAHAMAIEVAFMIHFVLVPIIVLAALVPLAPNGLGLRETAFVILYGQFGVAAESAFVLGLAWSLVLVAYGLAGGAAMVFERRRAGRVR